ncbi:MAG: HAMP domain-containing histidine kinase [Roseburia sp.]|nr:HAMP domain-containing histidine kinase [Roseburia sp.]
MKHIWYKRWLRFLAAVLCIFSFNLTGLSFAGIVICESLDIEGRNRDDILERACETLCREYSIRALSDYRDDFEMEGLKDTRFRYGVIKSSDIEDVDLNDRDIYEVCNFEPGKTIDREELGKSITQYSCTIQEGTYFHVENPLLGNSYITNSWHGSEDALEEVDYVIKQVYYTADTGRFYYLAQTEGKENLLYPVYEEVGQSESGVPMAELVIANPGDEETTYEWMDSTTRVIIQPEVFRYLADVELTTYPKLAESGKIMPGRGEDMYTDYTCGEGVIHTWQAVEKEQTSYYVISYVSQDMPMSYTNDLFGLLEQWDNMDDFARVQSLIGTAYNSHYKLYGIFLFTLVVLLASLVLCLLGAGHNNGDEKVMPGFLQKIPFDLFFVLVWFVALLLVGLVTAVCVENDLSLGFRVFMGIPAAIGAELLALIFLMDFAVRVKTKTCIKSTLCYKILRFLLNWMKNGPVSWMKRVAGACREEMPMLLKALLLMGILAFVEFIFVAAGSNDGGLVLLFLLEKAVLYPIIILCLLQMRKLQQEAEKIADGDLENTVDTSRMFWEFKRHGENLNKIREGIGNAVEQRMKSERFKTELITNVSHDIKTPLTSIINYVDLLSKEETQNPKVQEYLEVLSRQSARLKKLIEDLMEASKASTGNLSVALESCNAGILVTQTIGEFQEKLSENQIELIVSGSEEEIIIPADTRHLYRVFENLMNNICKYALERTRAYVNVERLGRECVIIFRNISKYPLNIGSEDLMERFVRGDASRNTEGSGLGLSIANSLTELMGGRLNLITDGDLFKVELYFPVLEKSSDGRLL